MSRDLHYNGSGYVDYVAFKAISNVMKSERKTLKTKGAKKNGSKRSIND